MTDHLEGQIIDSRYQVISRLGSGGMGTVYEAMHLALGKRVALKVLQSSLAENKTYRERFLREARATTRIESPHVVQVLDFGKTESLLYFTMERLRGQDFERHLRAWGPMSWQALKPIFSQITSAVGAAHDSSVVHRDIKPANCFLCDTPSNQPLVKILDFGIAKLVDAADGSDMKTRLTLMQSLTSTGEIIGTAAYMAPELILGQAADPRSDIYALGIMMFRALAGTLPFRGDSAFAVFEQHVKAPTPSLRGLNQSTSPAIEQVVIRALAKEPNLRFQSVAELEQALIMADHRDMMPATLDLAGPTIVAEPIQASPHPYVLEAQNPARTTRNQGISATAVLLFVPVAVMVAVAAFWAGRSGAPEESEAKDVAVGKLDANEAMPADVPSISSGDSDDGSETGEAGEAPVAVGMNEGLETKSGPDGAIPTPTESPVVIAQAPKAKVRPIRKPLSLEQRAGRDCPTAIGGIFTVRGRIDGQGAYSFETVEGGEASARACIQKFVKTLRFASDKGKVITTTIRPQAVP